MSKSIYYYGVLELYEEEQLELFELVEQALKQAQKQEQLLGLYQKYYHDYDDLTMNEEIDIRKQIKELEKQ